jgi:predicted nucleic acid-binding protein
VDASVAAKWYVEEEGAEQALSLLLAQHNGKIGLHVPELFFAEIGNIVWKKQRMGQMLRPHVDQIVQAVSTLPLHVHSLSTLLPDAVRLACELDRTVYDAIYLALALSLGTEMVTADLRLHNRLSASPYHTHVRWVGQL